MGLTPNQAAVKRVFDVIGALIGLSLTWWIILLAWVLATIDTRKNGFFMQPRVGKNGRLFHVIKIRTMRNLQGIDTTVTTDKDPRVTPVGRCFRRTKIDELPQLINVLLGHMSFVGPRPDVPGYADEIEGHDRIILSVRPGITGPATLKYQDEEVILANQDDPDLYNREVIFPDKVRINREYIENWRMLDDIRYIWRTAIGR